MLRMTPELTALCFAALLQILQIALYAVLGNLQVGVAYSLKPRDEPRVLSGVAGRAQRAMNNHFESLLLFAIACLVIAISETSSVATGVAAWTYVAARALYVPAYCFGWVPWRSVFWSIGLGAITILLIGGLI